MREPPPMSKCQSEAKTFANGLREKRRQSTWSDSGRFCEWPPRKAEAKHLERQRKVLRMASAKSGGKAKMQKNKTDALRHPFLCAVK